jgi:hypothetical protein
MRIKREHKPWLMILAWLALLGVFLYCVVKVSEKYSGSIDWP